MATMGTMLLRGVLPLSSSDLRRLVIRSKSPEGGGGRASSDSLRSALPAGLRAWILETGDGLEIICKAADHKELRKTLKSQRKEMAFSLDKKEDEHLSQALFQRVLEQEMLKTLVSRGWVCLKDGLIRTTLEPASDDGKPILMAKDVSIHLSDETSLVLLCNPGIVKLYHFDMPSLLPATLRETLESSGRVCLTDWLECLPPEEQQRMRCMRLPSLEPGWITGVSKAGAVGQVSSSVQKDMPPAPLPVDKLFYDFRSNDSEGDSSMTPATHVLRAGGIVPAPFLQRQAHIGSVLPTLASDLRLDLLGAGTLQLQASGEQAKTVTFDDTWTTAGSGMRSQPQLQSAQQLSLNLKEGVGPLWRRARPEPLRTLETSTEEDARAALTEGGVKWTNAATATLSVPPAAVPVPLLVPKFGPRAPKGSLNKRKPERPDKARGPEPSKAKSARKVSEKSAPMPVSKKATVPTFSEATAPAAKKAKTASAAASEPASKHVGAPTAKKAKASPDVESKKTGAPDKGDIPKPPPKKPEGTAKTDGAPKPPAKKPAPKESFEDVDAMVREKFSAGKLKDLTLPRLKQFISSHKLGKVGGKKEELLAIVEAFLRAGKKES